MHVSKLYNFKSSALFVCAFKTHIGNYIGFGFTSKHLYSTKFCIYKSKSQTEWVIYQHIDSHLMDRAKRHKDILSNTKLNWFIYYFTFKNILHIIHKYNLILKKDLAGSVSPLHGQTCLLAYVPNCQLLGRRYWLNYLSEVSSKRERAPSCLNSKGHKHEPSIKNFISAPLGQRW